MKFCGIICEFNPLHNGHEYLISKAKEKGYHVICLMSGNFSQRGLPCCMNKFERAKLAIMAGASIVLELPTVYAVNNADEFAYGAIKILKALNIDHIMFGSESDDKENLEKLADFRLNEPQEFRELLKQNLDKGMSYNNAYLSAMTDITSDNSLQKLLSSPNDILASSYIKEIKKQKANLSYELVKRTDNGYNSTIASFDKLSASAILELKKQNKDYSSFVPTYTKEALDNSPLFDFNIFSALLKNIISCTPPQKLNKIFGMEEGLEYLLSSTFSRADTMDNYLQILQSKRYRKSRINKLLLTTLLNITKTDYKKIKAGKPAVKVLAVNKNKKQLLSTMSLSNDINLIITNKDYAQITDNSQITSLEIDSRASNLYSICSNQNLNLDRTIGTIFM